MRITSLTAPLARSTLRWLKMSATQSVPPETLTPDGTARAPRGQHLDRASGRIDRSTELSAMFET